MAIASVRAAPHNVFRTRGEDRWIAVALETDAQWCALVELMGSPAELTDPRLADLRGWLAQRDDIDAHLETWTAEQDTRDLMARLHAAGTPSGVVHRGDRSV